MHAASTLLIVWPIASLEVMRTSRPTSLFASAATYQPLLSGMMGSWAPCAGLGMLQVRLGDRGGQKV